MSKVTSLDAPPLFSAHEAMCWKAGYNEAQAALGARLNAAERLLEQANDIIEILQADANNRAARHGHANEIMTAIERHWQTYPEPLE